MVAIAQGPNGDLLLELIDLLYDREMMELEPEYFSPEDRAEIQAGLEASRQGERSQFVYWEELKKELGL